MKINYIFVTILSLFFHHFVNAQKLEVSKPIDNALEKSTLFGNTENGYIRILQDNNDVTINILNSETLKTIKSIENDNILKGKWFKGIFEINNKILLFFYKYEGKSTSLYQQILNRKTGEFGKETLVASFLKEQDYSDDGVDKFKVYQSLDLKNLVIVYSQNQDKRDFRKFKINKKNKDFLAFNIIVLDENLEKVVEKEAMFDNLIYWHYFKTFVYDKKNNNVYLTMRFLLRGGERQEGTAIIDGSKNYAEFITFSFDKNIQLNASSFYRNNLDRIFLIGTYWNTSKQKYVYFSYDVEELKEISAKEFSIERHPSIKKDILNRNYATISTRILQIKEFNNELYIAYNLDFSNPRQNGYDRYKHLLNVAIVKLDKEGNIDLLKIIPISEEVYGGISGKKFCFQAQENSIHGVFIDKYYNYKLEGKELDGNYLSAFLIDQEKEINYTRLSKLKDINDPNYFLLEQCVYSENKISSFMFIKKKQDIVVSVSFDE